MMREWLELDSVEICTELSISDGNCRVLLYRARMQLRECLGTGWFREAT
jgi:RNA polymerase sigma-70 factor (ECF subfamily)